MLEHRRPIRVEQASLSPGTAGRWSRGRCLLGGRIDRDAGRGGAGKQPPRGRGVVLAGRLAGMIPHLQMHPVAGPVAHLLGHGGGLVVPAGGIVGRGSADEQVDGPRRGRACRGGVGTRRGRLEVIGRVGAGTAQRDRGGAGLPAGGVVADAVGQALVEAGQGDDEVGG